MRFIERKRARPVIPLVSLIDILTILLIFFIVTSEFRQQEKQKAKAGQAPANERRLDIALPGVSEMSGAAIADKRSAIGLTADGAILLDGTPLADPAALIAALNARRAANPSAAFELEPDERVPLGKVITVWDALTKAGIPVAEVPARVLKKP